MRDYQDRFEARGANLAAIGLGDKLYARMFREDSRITFPLLIDEERLAYKAAGLKSANLLHILRSDNAASRSRARSAGHKQRRTGKNPFQLGGSFVFGPGNVDVFSHLSKTFGDNASPDQLLAAIK